jgi:hypothetical protein
MVALRRHWRHGLHGASHWHGCLRGGRGLWDVRHVLDDRPGRLLLLLLLLLLRRRLVVVLLRHLEVPTCTMAKPHIRSSRPQRHFGGGGQVCQHMQAATS